MGAVTVGIPGHHNALNAAAALTIAMSLGIPFETAGAGLAGFTGVARRFETRGEHLGIRFVDDYAHLPAEVEAAVATALRGPWNRVTAAYQPHRYSRTEALGRPSRHRFVVLTIWFSPTSTPQARIPGQVSLPHRVRRCHGCLPGDVGQLATIVERRSDPSGERLGPGDLCLTMGAGDLTTLPDLVLEELRATADLSVDWLRELAPQLASPRCDSTIRSVVDDVSGRGSGTCGY